jgi:hypothetical protein
MRLENFVTRQTTTDSQVGPCSGVSYNVNTILAMQACQ